MGRTSMYGRAALNQQMYGISAKSLLACDCVPSFSPLDQISALIDVISNMEILFKNYFKATGVVLPLHATMGVGARTNAAVGTRIIWRHENPGIMFNRDSEIHRLQLKSIYLNNGWNWRTDPLLK